ncbi:MAG: winged helix-turn-helix transcriptional regulator [Aestuariivirga sp.]|uniref:MarR family winged helix-turn-helix transcriptional regulator n=1 Tax=Aestuariivirga sp. TaxID=2650926 RepID=UPI0025C3E2B1|nr:MarR family winged helix-turn-helix transcriptional regulator [Aestuariivirga sp.]MCA3560546.1 winged helix-turn-helix transcriptional regulator [Aestuariivirga sp.]
MSEKVLPARHAANVIGALALGLADRMVAETEALVGAGANASAALILIGNRPDLTIDALRHGLHLTHSATVRTVTRLKNAGLVEKRSGKDARSVYLRLSASGKREMARALAQREKILAEALADLSVEERVAMGALAARVLPCLAPDAARAEAVCRLCDGGQCPDDLCPLTPERQVAHGAQ